ncbi:MAG TPA: hypothetical protein H9729_01140, partial [Candidatus Borkfalkia excrementigallinarum]|nr:hypothetical protein [Candidatus Borkfalkia excrementigallinarum]
ARLSLACNSENERTVIAFGDYKRKFREFKENPIVLATLGAIGVFLTARCFKGTHIIKSRGFTRGGRRYATN